jgi:hypothetical protein
MCKNSPHNSGRTKTDDSVERFSPGRARFLGTGILFVLLFAGLFIRTKDLEAFQVGDRQYRSALIARAYYLQSVESTPEWRREVAEVSSQRAGLLEPPLMELWVSWIYRLINHEHLWIPRFFSSLFWVMGGYLLYKVMERFSGGIVALLSTAYYLFVPSGVYISTGFVPDPLMSMLFVLSILMMIRYYEQPSNLNLFIAGLVSALSVLVKPFSLFALVGAFLLPATVTRVDRNRNTRFHALIFLCIISLPLTYYAYGIFTGGSLLRQAQSSFIPGLLLTRSYWLDWLSTASGVVEFPFLVMALIGLSFARKGMLGALLLGLWAGYAIFCLLFNYHIRFGPHYHSQLIVIATLSMGPLISVIIEHFGKLAGQRYRWLPMAAGLILMFVMNYRDVRSQLPGLPVSAAKDIAQRVGEITGHSTKTVYLAQQYGTPLEYYGELSGSYWPRNISDRDRALGVVRARSVEERLSMLDYFPEYFVITDIREYYAHHSDLKEYLESNCSLLADSDEYLIYNDCMD